MSTECCTGQDALRPIRHSSRPIPQARLVAAPQVFSLVPMRLSLCLELKL